jgi:hypothetical protein
MIQVFCITLVGESVVLPAADEGAEYGFYRNEYVLATSSERAIEVAKARTIKKLAKRSIESVKDNPLEMKVERIIEQMPLSRLLRNEGFQFFRTDCETAYDVDDEETDPNSPA